MMDESLPQLIDLIPTRVGVSLDRGHTFIIIVPVLKHIFVPRPAVSHGRAASRGSILVLYQHAGHFLQQGGLAVLPDFQDILGQRIEMQCDNGVAQ